MTAPHPDSSSGDQRWRDPHPHPEQGSGGSGASKADRARAVGRGLGAGARGAARGVRGVARVTGRAGGYTVRQARRAARAEGAGDSGLSRLIEMHAFNTAGDAAVAISLAGTLFFQVPTGEARGQVALFLGLTMLPFAIVAPLIGPFLDRFSHGRRWAIGATMALRAFLCWVLASAVVTGSTVLFPAALGVLVASKAYGVTRAAAVPRLVPKSFTLVKANARISLAGIVGAGVSAPLAGLASTFGAQWSLRYAFVLFVIATVLAILLPAKVDSSQGEITLALGPGPTGTAEMPLGDAPGGRRGGRGRAARAQVPPAVAFALRANAGPRFLSGFLIMFMAFLLRENPIGDWRTEVLLGIVLGGAGLGNALGIAIGSTLRQVNSPLLVVVALAADAGIVLVSALFYGVVTLGLLGLTAGLAQALAKLALDATIQRDVPERVQSSAFARSDTTLQLAWVIGGFVGIAMPLLPRLGLGVACAVLAAWLAFVLVSRPGQDRPVRVPGR
ncbi:MFS transporter [Nocardioides sp. KIGAM211]|uniref:MFS transporter n=1 Tax=Nocardioides luti TaxID=2761101 RepID=A0A7X0VCX2_9ACTN|nr:MFS transporter [Nocardioides luti]MBB6628693.1 MFS transporter [Nocardioides luti]